MHQRKKYRLPGQNSPTPASVKLAACVLACVVVAVVAWFLYRQTAPPDKVVATESESRDVQQQPALSAPDVTPQTRTGAIPIAPHPSPTNALARDVPSDNFPRPIRTVFEGQVALLRLGISPGLIDGVFGPRTSTAIAVFQRWRNLPVTGHFDPQTRAALVLAFPPLTNYVVTTSDLARLQPLSTTWLGKSKQAALEYESVLELVAEKAFSHPNMIRALNPQIDWANVTEGTRLVVPGVSYANPARKAAFISILLSEKSLRAFDEQTNLLVHFPCSIARHAEKRPVGELRVTTIVPNPNYTFDPAKFPESAEARQLNQKLILPPGPNNPVGVAWIGLDRPGYGIHGTPNPERVGRSESHGCFRLANWNAEYLLKLVWIGMPVYVEP